MLEREEEVDGDEQLKGQKLNAKFLFFLGDKLTGLTIVRRVSGSFDRGENLGESEFE